MPRRCACGARLRVDRTCPEAACRAFRPSRRGCNLATKHVANCLRGKQKRELGKDYRAQPSSPPAVAASDPHENRSPQLQRGHAAVRERLRAPQLEALLVDMFDHPGYFAILATAFRWLHRCPSAVDGVSAELAAVSLILTGANFEGLSARGRPRSLLIELSDYSGHSYKQIIGRMVLFCNEYHVEPAAL
jgi:hypothetical protein